MLVKWWVTVIMVSDGIEAGSEREARQSMDCTNRWSQPCWHSSSGLLKESLLAARLSLCQPLPSIAHQCIGLCFRLFALRSHARLADLRQMQHGTQISTLYRAVSRIAHVYRPWQMESSRWDSLQPQSQSGLHSRSRGVRTRRTVGRNGHQKREGVRGRTPPRVRQQRTRGAAQAWCAQG